MFQTRPSFLQYLSTNLLRTQSVVPLRFNRMSSDNATIYAPDKVLQIYSHEPPSPTEQKFDLLRVPKTDRENFWKEQKQFTPLELCLQYPPMPGGKSGKKAINLKFTRQILTGLRRSSQLLKVEVDGILKDRLVLAKIYDPLYCDNEDGCIDPFRLADFEYSHEYAAYMKLEHMQGKAIPQFYGSYTSNIPVDLHTDRQVRLILFEYVDGICLSSLDQEGGPDLSQSARQNILRKLIEIEAMAYAYGVNHGDLDTRNVMVRSEDLDCFIDPKIQVTLIDFALARIGPLNLPWHDDAISPLIRWCERSERANDFWLRGWIDWDWDQWLKQCFAHSKAYTPITPEMINWWGGYCA